MNEFSEHVSKIAEAAHKYYEAFGASPDEIIAFAIAIKNGR